MSLLLGCGANAGCGSAHRDTARSLNWAVRRPPSFRARWCLSAQTPTWEDATVINALLDRAREGDEQAFAELTGPLPRELHVHCYRILGSVQDAEDVLQETLLAAWRGLEAFERPA